MIRLLFVLLSFGTVSCRKGGANSEPQVIEFHLKENGVSEEGKEILLGYRGLLSRLSSMGIRHPAVQQVQFLVEPGVTLAQLNSILMEYPSYREVITFTSHPGAYFPLTPSEIEVCCEEPEDLYGDDQGWATIVEGRNGSRLEMEFRQSDDGLELNGECLPPDDVLPLLYSRKSAARRSVVTIAADALTPMRDLLPVMMDCLHAGVEIKFRTLGEPGVKQKRSPPRLPGILACSLQVENSIPADFNVFGEQSLLPERWQMGRVPGISGFRGTRRELPGAL